MDEISINARLRHRKGKEAAHKLRAAQAIPGIFYLSNEINLPIEMDAHEFHQVIRKKPSILRLKLDDGREYECVIRELQQDPVSGKNLHVDLMGIVRGRNVTVQVPIELEGSAVGVRTQGGVLQHVIHSLNIECLPRNIPEKITMDISELHVGESLHVRDVQLQNVRILDDPDRTIVSILAPRVEKVVEEVEEEVEEVEGGEEEGEEKSE